MRKFFSLTLVVLTVLVSCTKHDEVVEQIKSEWSSSKFDQLRKEQLEKKLLKNKKTIELYAESSKKIDLSEFDAFKKEGFEVIYFSNTPKTIEKVESEFSSDSFKIEVENTTLNISAITDHFSTENNTIELWVKSTTNWFLIEVKGIVLNYESFDTLRYPDLIVEDSSNRAVFLEGNKSVDFLPSQIKDINLNDYQKFKGQEGFKIYYYSNSSREFFDITDEGTVQGTLFSIERKGNAIKVTASDDVITGKYGESGEIWIRFKGAWFLLAIKRLSESQISKLSNQIELNKKIDQITKDYMDKTDYEKIKFAYDYLIKNVVYPKTDLTSSRYSAYGAIIEGKAVCNGYALGFIKIMNKLGVKSMYVRGRINGTTGHAWNLVLLEGKWYHLDATWGDTDYKDLVNYNYFLKSNDTFLKEHVWAVDQYDNVSKTDYTLK